MTIDKKLKILVVEDNEKHIEDAKEFFADKPVEVVYAKTYTEVKDALKNDPFEREEPDIDGIITDVFFPYANTPDFEPQAIGVRVATKAEKMKIPFVINTDEFRHGHKVEWVYGMANENRWPFLASGKRDYETRETIPAEQKDWTTAYNMLQRQIK